MQIFYFPTLTLGLGIGREITWLEQLRSIFVSVIRRWIHHVQILLEATSLLYIYISCVSYIFRPPLTRMYIFHRLFFCRVVNHEDASRIRTKVACLRYLRILSFPKLYSLLPWKGRRLIPRFRRWIKTKKNLKNILLSFVESNILDKSLYVFIPYLYI